MTEQTVRPHNDDEDEQQIGGCVLDGGGDVGAGRGFDDSEQEAAESEPSVLILL